MAESNTTDNLRKKTVRVPKRPLKDLSSRPQRPISLKTDIETFAARTKSEPIQAQSPVAASVPPRPKKKMVRKKVVASEGQWTLSGVSTQAREAAIQAAEAEGLKVDEWLEQLILKTISARKPTETHEEIELPLLNEIRERLDRIEQERGTASRFWYWLTEWIKQLIRMGH